MKKEIYYTNLHTRPISVWGGPWNLQEQVSNYFLNIMWGIGL